MLTLKDLLKLQKMISDTFDEKLKQFYEEHIKYLPTKDEFFTRMDKLSGEIQAVRESQELHQGQHTDIADRFERIDKHLGISTTA